ncbi:MAG: recombinase RecA [Candidatus Adiutrix sp.]|jgi:recombination protein RecA|nr:recombinase RecA [Candidatus Adiutrix sp.]
MAKVDKDTREAKEASAKKKDKGLGPQEAREKALSLALEQIEKGFGKGSIMKLGEQEQVDIPVISTGSLALDAALGIGGFPRGRIIEIYGPESSGKTTLALHAVAEIQKQVNQLGQAGLAAYIDAEHALDVSYARRLGVNTDELLISQPDHGEQALDIAEILVRSGAVDLIVIDSVAALVPEAEINGEMGDSHVGLQARLMSQALRKLTGAIHRSMASVIFINQVRQKIGNMGYGPNEVTTGGNALKFYATQRIEVRYKGKIMEGEERLGNLVRAKVVKNKLAPPFREVEFEIIFGRGISKEGELLDIGTAMNIVDKSGAWYSYNGERLGQGKENSRRFLQENKDVAAEIETKLRGAYGLVSEKLAEAIASHDAENTEVLAAEAAEVAAAAEAEISSAD